MGRRLGVLILFFALSGLAILMGSSMMGSEGGTDEDSPGPTFQNPASRVKVEVLNGGGVSGVAWDATLALRNRGFDVVFYGNAGTFSEDPSVVSDRVGRLETARDVAAILGISQVKAAPDTTRLVDVSVRLGPDWAGPIVVEEKVAPPRPWWDLRRVFEKDDEPHPEPPSWP